MQALIIESRQQRRLRISQLEFSISQLKDGLQGIHQTEDSFFKLFSWRAAILYVATYSKTKGYMFQGRYSKSSKEVCLHELHW